MNPFIRPHTTDGLDSFSFVRTIPLDINSVLSALLKRTIRDYLAIDYDKSETKKARQKTFSKRAIAAAWLFGENNGPMNLELVCDALDHDLFAVRRLIRKIESEITSGNREIVEKLLNHLRFTKDEIINTIRGFGPKLRPKRGEIDQEVAIAIEAGVDRLLGSA